MYMFWIFINNFLSLVHKIICSVQVLKLVRRADFLTDHCKRCASGTVSAATRGVSGLGPYFFPDLSSHLKISKDQTHKMVRVAIAGGTGNLGRTLVDAIVERGGHEVFVISRKV